MKKIRKSGEQDREQLVEVFRLALGANIDLRLPLGAVARKHVDDAVDAALDAAGKVLGLEARDDGAGDDDRRQRVGQRTFEPVADLDPHLALVGRDQKQHAVILLCLAELPEAEELIGVGLDVAALQRLHRGDDELDAGFVFQRFRFRLDVALAVGRHHAGLIDHAAGELREIEGEGERGEEAKQDSDTNRSASRTQSGAKRCTADPGSFEA